MHASFRMGGPVRVDAQRRVPQTINMQVRLTISDLFIATSLKSITVLCYDCVCMFSACRNTAFLGAHDVCMTRPVTAQKTRIIFWLQKQVANQETSTWWFSETRFLCQYNDKLNIFYFQLFIIFSILKRRSLTVILNVLDHSFVT